MTVFSDMGNYSTISQTSKSRDPRWLQVEVCREFNRDRCPRPDDECRFAHPPAGCLVEDGKVTACFDAMKGRCQREKCKYLHPPEHIKNHLETLGRSFQHYRNRSLSQHAMLSEMLSDMRINPVSAEQYPSYQLPIVEQPYLQTSMENVLQPRPPMTYPRRADKSDKLRVCDEFLQGTCPLSEEDCTFAHSPEYISVDSEGMVTVCMDFVKGHCQRNSCRYFHPPKSMVARVRSVQYRPYGKIDHHPNSMPYHGTQPYVFMPAFYQQQMMNAAPIYPYPQFIQAGVPHRAYMMPTYPYAIPSASSYATVFGDSPVCYSAQPTEMQAISSVMPPSPASTISVASSAPDNVDNIDAPVDQ